MVLLRCRCVKRTAAAAPAGSALRRHGAVARGTTLHAASASAKPARRLQGNGGRGKESGNGRIVVAKLREDENGCKWATQKVIKVPATANFRDYSDMDVHHSKDGPVARIAITSQVRESRTRGRALSPACTRPRAEHPVRL